MGIPARCESCSATFKVPDRFAGKRVRCVLCGQPVKIALTAEAAAVASPAGAPVDDFSSALDDAVVAEHEAESFDAEHERRKGKADFRTGIWPWRRMTEIAGDATGLRVETHRVVFGLIASTTEIATKSLTAVERRVIVVDAGKARNRWTLCLLTALLGLFAIIVLILRDWALSRIVYGIAGDLARLAQCIAVFLLFTLVFGFRFVLLILRSRHHREARTSVRTHGSRLKAKSMANLKGSWRGDELDGTHVVALTVRDGKPITLYRGSDPERADVVTRQAAKITGLPVKREIQD